MIYLIGMGTGAEGFRTKIADEIIRTADIVIGASRLLENLGEEVTARRFAEYRTDCIMELLRTESYGNAAILFSGDVCFYSGAKKLHTALENSDLLDKQQLKVIPGISSLSYFCGKIGASLQEVGLYSVHGQSCDVVSAVMQGKPAFFLTGGKDTVSEVARTLLEAGCDDLQVTVGENLSYADEKITTMTMAEAASYEAAPLAVMLVEEAKVARRGLPGIPDDAFLRGQVPMTKRMVRMSAICLLNPKKDEVCWDIGAGTGSVSVELALQSRCVYAIERKDEALELIRQNRAKFHAYNLHVVAGEAPAALAGLEAPQAVFIGGSNGHMVDILALLPPQQVRVCVTAVTLETLEGARTAMEQAGFHPQVTQLAVTETRNVGQYHMLDGQNPVFIIYGER